MSDGDWQFTSEPFNDAGLHIGPCPPKQAQRQDSLNDQMADVLKVAHRMGCHDAYDWITRRWGVPRDYAYERAVEK